MNISWNEFCNLKSGLEKVVDHIYRAAVSVAHHDALEHLALARKTLYELQTALNILGETQPAKDPDDYLEELETLFG